MSGGGGAKKTRTNTRHWLDLNVVGSRWRPRDGGRGPSIKIGVGRKKIGKFMKIWELHENNEK